MTATEIGEFHRLLAITETRAEVADLSATFISDIIALEKECEQAEAEYSESAADTKDLKKVYGSLCERLRRKIREYRDSLNQKLPLFEANGQPADDAWQPSADRRLARTRPAGGGRKSLGGHGDFDVGTTRGLHGVEAVD